MTHAAVLVNRTLNTSGLAAASWISTPDTELQRLLFYRRDQHHHFPPALTAPGEPLCVIEGFTGSPGTLLE